MPKTAQPSKRQTPIDYRLRFFDTSHLPEELAAVAQPFEKLAKQLVKKIADGPHLSIGLGHLLAAKDAIVRAHICGLESNGAPAPTNKK